MKHYLPLIMLLFSFASYAQEAKFDLSYGPDKRNLFDIWLPKKTKKKSPLVIYIHAGGFVSGDKTEIRDKKEMIDDYLAEGYAVASIRYRFLDTTPLQTIMREDIGGFVQYIRAHAETFNIDKKRIVSMGASAGGSASLWLATHDDIKDPDAKDPVKRESSRIIAFAHINSQAGYDFIDWFKYFGQKETEKFLKAQVWSRYHLKELSDLYTEEGERIRQDLDSVNNMDENDAPMYLFNSLDYVANEKMDYNYFLHGPHHAHVLKSRAEETGLGHEAFIKADKDVLPANLWKDIHRFFKKHLSKKKRFH